MPEGAGVAEAEDTAAAEEASSSSSMALRHVFAVVSPPREGGAFALRPTKLGRGFVEWCSLVKPPGFTKLELRL